MSAAVTFGIESSNIVGYTTKEAAKGQFIILGAQFEGVAGGTKINDLISGLVGADFDEELAFAATAPQIQVPDDGAYKTYYYLNDGWYDDGSAEGAVKPGWCNLGGELVDDELIPGVAMWAKSVTANANITVSGAVGADDVAEIDCPATFSLRANTFPLNTVINSEKMVTVGIAGADFDEELAFAATAPQIQVPDDGAYKTYYYLNDGWYDDGSTEGAVKPGWCNLGGELVDDVIPAAQGFWTKGVGSSFKFKFSK